MQDHAGPTGGPGAFQARFRQRAPDASALAGRIDGQHPNAGLTLAQLLGVRVVRAGDEGDAAEQLARPGPTATSTQDVRARRATSRSWRS